MKRNEIENKLIEFVQAILSGNYQFISNDKLYDDARRIHSLLYSRISNLVDKILETKIEEILNPISEKQIKIEEYKQFIESEKFIDLIINRINRKQLKNK